MLNGKPRQESQRDGLLAKRVRPGNERLRGDDGSSCGQKHQAELKETGMRYHREEDVPLFDVLTGKQHRSLTEVIQEQRHLGKAPAPTNRTGTEVTHIRVESFPSRNTEGNRAEGQQR